MGLDFKIAKFEKVSFEQFEKDCIDTFFPQCNDGNFTEERKIIVRKNIKEWYDKIQIPKRSTSGSAGYDFFAYTDFTLLPNCNVKIPSGIRVKMDNGWVLQCYPRSSHGFKYGIELSNTVGIIDSDYYNANNEGHMFFKLVNKDSTMNKRLYIKDGEAYCQGIFVPFGITVDDNADGDRVGGFGSTNKN